MKVFYQFAILCALCIAGDVISAVLPFAFPGAVISMILCFLLLTVHVIRERRIKETADFLMKNMIFLFVPYGAQLIESFPVFQDTLVQLVVICVVSTVVTFAATAYTVQLVMHLQKKYRERRSH